MSLGARAISGPRFGGGRSGGRVVVKGGRLPIGGKTKPNRGARVKSEGGGGFFSGLWQVIVRLFNLTLITAIILGVSVGLLAGYRWLTTVKYFALKEIEITGLERLSRQQVLEAAGLELGQNSLSLSLSKLETAISHAPWVETASVRRVLPDKLYVEILEYRPSYQVLHEDTLYYADERGRLVDKVDPGKFISLPSLEIESGMERQLGHLAELRKLCDADKAPFKMSEVGWLRLSWRHGIEVQLMDRPLLICLGVDNFSKNMQNLNHVWNNLAKRGELGEAVLLSAQNGRVWVEKRQAAVQ